MTLFMISTLVSLIFMFSKAPLMLSIMIVSQTIVVALSIYTFLSTSWLSYILFMIFVSAMMVIFVYVSSLASNDFFVLPHSVMWHAGYFLPLLALLTYMLMAKQENHLKTPSNLSDTDLTPLTSYKLYMTNTSSITMFLIVYLLIALIVVAKISMSPKGALRALKY
nr:TPA_asm: ND6 [Echiuropus macronychus]